MERDRLTRLDYHRARAAAADEAQDGNARPSDSGSRSRRSVGASSPFFRSFVQLLILSVALIFDYVVPLFLIISTLVEIISTLYSNY